MCNTAMGRSEGEIRAAGGVEEVDLDLDRVSIVVVVVVVVPILTTPSPEHGLSRRFRAGRRHNAQRGWIVDAIWSSSARCRRRRAFKTERCSASSSVTA